MFKSWQEFFYYLHLVVRRRNWFDKLRFVVGIIILSTISACMILGMLDSYSPSIFVNRVILIASWCASFIFLLWYNAIVVRMKVRQAREEAATRAKTQAEAAAIKQKAYEEACKRDRREYQRQRSKARMMSPHERRRRMRDLHPDRLGRDQTKAEREEFTELANAHSAS